MTYRDPRKDKWRIIYMHSSIDLRQWRVLSSEFGGQWRKSRVLKPEQALLPKEGDE
jgi:hypothetical protein